MAEISNIISGIKTRVQAVLTSNYNELSFATNIEQNSFNGNAKRFGVLSLGISQDEDLGVTGVYTINHEFSVILTDLYASSQSGDSNKQSIEITLTEKIFEIYKDLIATKLGVPSTVININNLNIEEREYIEESKVVVCRATFNVLYRISIS